MSSETWKHVGAIVKDLALIAGMLFAYLEARDARREASAARQIGIVTNVKADANAEKLDAVSSKADTAAVHAEDAALKAAAGRAEVKAMRVEIKEKK